MRVWTLVTSYTDRGNRTSLESLRTFGAEERAKATAEVIAGGGVSWDGDDDGVLLDGRGTFTEDAVRGSLRTKVIEGSSKNYSGLSFALYSSEVEGESTP